MYAYLDPTLPAVDTFALTLKTTHSNLCLIQHNWGPAELTQGSWIDPGPGSIQQNWRARTLPHVLAWLWMAHRWDYSLSCCIVLEQKCLKRLGLCFPLNCRKSCKNRVQAQGIRLIHLIPQTALFCNIITTLKITHQYKKYDLILQDQDLSWTSLQPDKGQFMSKNIIRHNLQEQMKLKIATE